MPAGLVMMVLSPVSGRLSRVVGPRVLLIMGAIALVAAYAFVLIAGSEVWHIFVSNLLIGVGIGFGFAAMPMLIMRSVPAERDGRLERAQRALPLARHEHRRGRHGRGARLVVDGPGRRADPQRRPGSTSPTCWPGGGAVLALVLALFIPAHHAPEERHPSLPE